jgi:hypothetical protein
LAEKVQRCESLCRFFSARSADLPQPVARLHQQQFGTAFSTGQSHLIVNDTFEYLVGRRDVIEYLIEVYLALGRNSHA